MKLTKNFHLSEFACKDGTPVPDKYLDNVKELAANLQRLRDYIGEPIHVNSGYRTKSYNKKVGGAPASQHLTASAADIATKNRSPKEVKAIIEKLIKEGKMESGGIGLYMGWVHYDLGAVRRW